MLKVGIIGGTGMDTGKILNSIKEIQVDTPYGKPSDTLICGEIEGVQVVILPRHDRSHSTSPTNVNYRANIWALKEQGCTHILVTTAVGSLTEKCKPGDIVLLDQFIDRTTKREQSFYDGKEGHPKGICHFPFAEPFCSKTRELLKETAQEMKLDFHESGTNVTIEGPRFSSRAESKLFHSWGADTINMTCVPEVILAREAGLSYAAIAIVTDYDSWRPDTEHVTIEIALRNFRKNAANAKDLLLKTISKMKNVDWTDTINDNKKQVQDSIM